MGRNKYKANQIEDIQELLVKKGDNLIIAYEKLKFLIEEWPKDTFLQNLYFQVSYWLIWHYYSLKHYESMEYFARLTIDLYHDEPHYSLDFARAYNGLALSLQKMGQPHLSYNLKANQLLNNELLKPLSQKDRITVLKTKIKNDFGIIIELGKAKKWEEAYNMVLSTITQSNEDGLELEHAQSLKIAGELLFQKGEHEKGFYYFIKAFNQLRKNIHLEGLSLELYKTTLLIAYNYDLNNRIDKVQEYLGYCKSNPASEDYLFYYLQGRVYEESSASKALKYYLKSIRILHKSKEDLFLESNIHNFLKNRQKEDLYIKVIDLLCQHNNISAAFHYLEIFRLSIYKRTLLQSFSQMEEDRVKLNLIKEKQNLIKTIEELRNQQTHNKKDIDKLQSHLYFLEERINQYYSPNKQTKTKDRVNIKEFQRHLKKNKQTAILHFYTQSRLYFFKISDNEKQIRTIDINTQALGHAVSSFIEITKMEVIKSNSHLNNTLQYYIQQLARYLIDPIKDWINQAHDLVFIPYGFLHNFPYPVLLLREANTPLFSIIPSAFLYIHLSKQKHSDIQWRNTLIVGNPDNTLPSAEKEALTLTKLMDQSQLLLGDQVSREKLICLLKQAQLFHFSGHIYYNKEKPLYSYLNLAAVSPNNRSQQLSVMDIYGFSFSDLKMVTLSGCSSGLSTQYRGEEQIGFVRAFLMAGAQSILASLWDIEDESAKYFMIQFYQAWIENDYNSRQAYLIALKKMKQKYPQSFYYGAYILYQ